MRRLAILAGLIVLAGCGLAEEVAVPLHLGAQSQGLSVTLAEVTGKLVRFQNTKTGEDWELSITPHTKLMAHGRPAELSQFRAGSKVRVQVQQALFLDMDNLWVGTAAQLTLLK